jgi:hypothetical protein
VKNRAKTKMEKTTVEKFAILLPCGTGINEKTRIGQLGRAIQTKEEIKAFIFNQWCKATDSNSFADWAEYLNNNGDYDGGFCEDAALDNLASTFTLNIDNQFVDLTKFWGEVETLTPNPFRILRKQEMVQDLKEYLAKKNKELGGREDLVFGVFVQVMTEKQLEIKITLDILGLSAGDVMNVVGIVNQWCIDNRLHRHTIQSNKFEPGNSFAISLTNLYSNK